MKIDKAKSLANLYRILYKFKVIDFNTLDKTIDHIQVLVLKREIRLMNKNTSHSSSKIL
jgi:hypothetical protein